jgi:hypothetical protein
MKLNTVIKAANNRISGGSDYGWQCFGPRARWMDFSNAAGTEIGSCIYDTLTQRVFAVDAYLDELNTHYSWYQKSTKADYEKEAKKREVDPYIAYDDKQTVVVDKKTILAILKTYAQRGSQEYDGINPASCWPFPTNETSKPNWDNATVTADNDEITVTDGDWASAMGEIDRFIDKLDDEGKLSDDYLDAADQFLRDLDRESALTEDQIEKAFPGSLPTQEYEVVLNVKNRFSVRATSMEKAATIATELVDNNMRITDWGKGVCWEDKWVSKKTVSVK